MAAPHWHNSSCGRQVLIIVTVVYIYAHYGFAGVTGHVIAMYVAFASLAISAGSPPPVSALLLAYASTLGMSLTHHGAGVAPAYFGASYIEHRTWWRIGFLASIVNVIIWLAFGLVWWKALGCW